MPIHDFKCLRGHVTERFVEHGVDAIDCPVCQGIQATKVFLKAPYSYVQPDICYDSPIDGRAITTKQARIEDLARNNCQEYDPGMKDDYLRRNKESEAKLEKLFDASVDEALEKMPAREKEKLESELAGGATAEPIRVTAPVKPLTVEIANV